MDYLPRSLGPSPCRGLDRDTEETRRKSEFEYPVAEIVSSSGALSSAMRMCGGFVSSNRHRKKGAPGIRFQASGL
jgi:hypothetical protein